ncbi:MAG: ParA family protein [Xenococcaceae cyanobacterium MO_167.B27]|nr:ParA family protein [Xenococcaceae cyanobacterium MO_167.B27]
MGQVISLVNQKGGVSKSTTSVHLSYWLITKKQQKTLLIDVDSQGSSSKWVQGMEEVEIPFNSLSARQNVICKDYVFALVRRSHLSEELLYKSIKMRRFD